MSYELILDFNYTAPKKDLYASLPITIKHKVHSKDSAKSQLSNYLLISTSELFDFTKLPNIRSVYPEKKLQHKFLRFLSDANGNKVTELIEAPELWAQGFKGRGVKIGILDSGINLKDRGYINISDCYDFTDEKNCEDSTGHGTFMASIIASNYSECPGIAPEAEVYAFKVFNSKKESKTSWFLDAFYKVKEKNIDILSISNGGINFLEEPFVSEITQLVASGVIVVSAAGNDGPGFGSLSNPGDQMEVIGVGGLDETGLNVAEFSSRGPTLWEIYGGSGRFKPDIVTYSVNIKGFYNGRCSSNTGTSISTPIIAGSIALIKSPNSTPANVRSAIMKSADRVNKHSIFEQGAGKLNLLAAKKALDSAENLNLYAFPPSFNNSDDYFYPYSLQPLYPFSPPLIINITIFNPLSPNGTFQVFNITNSDRLQVTTETSNFVSYTGTLGVFISTTKGKFTETFNIILKSDGLNLTIPIVVRVDAIPSKESRVLWDLGHNLKYPDAGPVIRDDLDAVYLFDFQGDHPFTNLLGAYKELIKSGFAVDFLYGDFSCADGNLYSIYLIIDPEKSFSEYEISKIRYDMEINKVSLILFGDWSDSKTLEEQLSYSDFQSGIPGCNVNTINDLVSPYFIEMSLSKSFSDTGRIGSQKFSVRHI